MSDDKIVVFLSKFKFCKLNIILKTHSQWRMLRRIRRLTVIYFMIFLFFCCFMTTGANSPLAWRGRFFHHNCHGLPSLKPSFSARCRTAAPLLTVFFDNFQIERSWFNQCIFSANSVVTMAKYPEFLVHQYTCIWRFLYQPFLQVYDRRSACWTRLDS